MSERRYTVWIEDSKKLDFNDFWDNFLHSEDEDYSKTYGGDLESEQQKFKNEIKQLFNESLEQGCFISDDYFYNRSFGWKLADYIATMGIPVRVSDIRGWSPQVIILKGKLPKIKKYLKEPKLDLEKRFDYMVSWAEKRGLIPKNNN